MAWDTDLFTCSQEVCKGLAFAKVRRRARRTTLTDAPQRYARALLASLETLEYALRRDVATEVLDAREAEEIRRAEREQTARSITQLRRLERPRHAGPATPPARPHPDRPRTCPTSATRRRRISTRRARVPTAA
jgi:hypothetical protein